MSLLSRIAYSITEILPNIKCGDGECSPNSKNPCCSPHGYCGISVDHCECEGCIDSRLKTPQIGNYVDINLKIIVMIGIHNTGKNIH